MKRILRRFFALALSGALVLGGAGLLAPVSAAAAGTPNLDKIQKELLEIMEDHDVPGMAIALVKGDEVIYSNALGVQDLKTNKPLAIDGIFRIASISKSFSGVSIMQLVEAGKLSLDDDVSDILGFSVRNPRFPDAPITVRMLLSHTSSVIDSKGVSYRDPLDETIIPGSAPAEKVAACYATYAPGKGYKYSNRGINLLGAVIEKVSGERFDNYVLNHILRPLGIESAGFNVDSLDRSRFTSLYILRDGREVPQPGAYKRFPQYDTYRLGIDTPVLSPAGGMKITILGLAEWMMTLKRGGIGRNGVRILSEASVEQMFQKATPPRSKVHDGFTLSTSSALLGFPMRGHGGSAYGLKSIMNFSPEQDFGVVVFCSSTDNKKNSRNGIAAYSEAAEVLYNAFIK